MKKQKLASGDAATVKRRQSMPARPQQVNGGGDTPQQQEQSAPNTAPRNHRKPFRRVEDDSFAVRPELADNSFAAKVSNDGFNSHIFLFSDLWVRESISG